MKSDGASDEAIESGTKPVLQELVPIPGPCPGAALLDELVATLRGYVVMDESEACATALWIVYTYAYYLFYISPRLAITSPQKRCGKTTLIDVLSRLVSRALPTANTTAAALYRSIEMLWPTLLIDEGDSFLRGNEALRNVINSGYQSGSGYVIRAVGKSHEPRRFCTFAPVVISMIGRLPETLEDRSIAIRLRRRLPHEPVFRLRLDRTEDLDRLARKCLQWVDANKERLALADPEIPPSLFNRCADNWRPLLAIADVAGGEWPVRARRVAETISARTNAADQSEPVMLLQDIRGVFSASGEERLPSADIVKALKEMEGRPWAEWKRGRALSANAMARLLATFEIAPTNIRMGEGSVLKGYYRKQFDDAFARYLGMRGLDEPLQRYTTQTLHPGWSGSAPSHRSCPQNLCSGVAVQTDHRRKLPDSILFRLSISCPVYVEPLSRYSCYKLYFLPTNNRLTIDRRTDTNIQNWGCQNVWSNGR